MYVDVVQLEYSFKFVVYVDNVVHVEYTIVYSDNMIYLKYTGYNCLLSMLLMKVIHRTGFYIYCVC